MKKKEKEMVVTAEFDMIFHHNNAALQEKPDISLTEKMEFFTAINLFSKHIGTYIM